MSSDSSPAGRVVIFGLGIVGSATALAILQRTRYSVVIYELRSAPATIGGAINLSPNANRVLATLGVPPTEYAGKTPWVLFQNEHGRRIGEFKYGGQGDAFAQGYEGMRVVRNDLQDSLIAALRGWEPSGRLRILFDQKASRITEFPDRIRVEFQDGTDTEGDLVIGADGIHSFTRSQLHATLHPTSSEGPRAVYSGVTTIYGLLPAGTLDTQVLRPLEAHQSIRTISPHAGLFALSYARADRSLIHWFSSRSVPGIAPSPTLTAPESVREELLSTYSTFPEPIPSVIRATPQIFYWPVYRLQMPSDFQWFSSSHGRIVLVGDAAHAMPPHAAQGVGMGVEDALLIANILRAVEAASPSSSESSPSRFSPQLWRREYQGRRGPRVTHFTHHAESQGRAREDSGWWVGKAREWGLWLAYPLINRLGEWALLGRIFGAIGIGASVEDGDVQGWGYDVDREVISLDFD